MALAPGTRLGAYEITAQIGVGGMGEVYRATDTKLRREVAIKVIPGELASDAERLARFQREAEVLASLNHPNIAAIYGLEDADGAKALVMELVEGQTLADRIAQGPIPAVEALLIARQIAEALEAAHERGIVHRDLKPANVKVRPDGVVKVLDFGLAKAVEPPGGASSSLSMAPTMATLPATTMQGMILGTPAYMSPEQARGKPVDRRTDVWAFGAMLFEMLTGAKPFPGDDVSQMLARVIERDPDWSLLPAATPARVARAIAVCLQKDPRQRVGDLSAVRLALDGAFETPAGPAPLPVTVGQPIRRRLAVALATLAAGALVGAVGWSLTRDAAPAQPLERFVITTPPDRPVITSSGINQVAVSPDGTHVAYGSATGNAFANLQIFVRAIGDLEPTLLRGTEGGGTSPFFSPDGQSIGFVSVTDNTLKRVSVNGGTPQTLGKFQSLPLGMEWAPDDTILFTLSGIQGGAPRALLRVPSGGGQPTPVTTVDVAAGDRAHASADVLPGGESAVFSILGASGWRLAVVSLATGTITDLKIAGGDPTYSPTGHLLFSTADGALHAIGFDADRLTVSGGSATVVESVSTRPEVTNVALASNGSLVYLTGGADATQRTLVWVDRSGREEPVGVPPRAYLTPRVSPDGTRVAVGIDGDIWVTELARPGTLRRVIAGPARERFPMWSPDGNRLLYESNETGAPAIFSRAADGRGDADLILTGTSKEWDLLSPEAWSADGRDLLFIYRPVGTATPNEPTGNNFNIGSVSLGGGPWRPLLDTGAAESNVVVSRDGRWIAYEADDTGQVEVYVERFPSLGGRQILSTGGGKNPYWSRDGRELFYRRGIGVDGAMMVSTIRTAPAFTMGAGTELFGGSYYYTAVGARTWDVAPDGRFLMMDTVEDDESNRAQIILVQNWFEELRRLVPVN